MGIAAAEGLKNLPSGDVSGVLTLNRIADELPTARSAIILGYHAFDPALNLAVDARLVGSQRPEGRSEWHQLYAEIVKTKAWQMVNYLIERGFDAIPSLSIALKPAAVIAGLGCRGKNTLLVTPEYGSKVRFVAVLTSAKLEPDEPFAKDLCNDCKRCIDACPTGALKPHEIDIRRCLTYAAESPGSADVEEDVRALERKLIRRPTPGSYIECTICIEACPIGRKKR